MNRKQGYWERNLRELRISRRRLLGRVGVAGIGAAGLALAGCGDDKSTETGNTPAPAGGATPKALVTPTNRDGVWRFHQAAPMATINPWVASNGAMWGMIIAVYDHLFAVPTDTGIPENFLAETLEMQDQTNFTIKIKPAVWQNKAPVSGRAITAEDLQKTFLGIKAQAKLSRDAWWDTNLDKVDVIDDKTLRISMKRPDAWTFGTTKFASPWVSIVLPREHSTNPSLMDNDLIGSGLWEFVSHENGTNIKVKRNETYRMGKDYLNLAGVQTRLIQEPAAAMAAFSAKELDSYVCSNKLEKDQLVQRHGKDITIESSLSNAVWRFYVRADGQWADARIQQAFSMALDRKEMISLITFGEGQVSGPVPPNHVAYALTEKEIADTFGKFDPAEAKKLLSATAFDASREYTLKFVTPGDNAAQFAQVVQSQLQKNLGIKTKLVGEDGTTWLLKSFYPQNFDMLTAASTAYEDPSSFCTAWDLQYGPVANQNPAGLKSQELSDLIAKAAANYDVKSRQQQVKDLQKRAWVLGNPYIPTYVGVGNTAYQGWVKNFQPASKGSYGYLAGTTFFEKH